MVKEVHSEVEQVENAEGWKLNAEIKINTHDELRDTRYEQRDTEIIPKGLTYCTCFYSLINKKPEKSFFSSHLLILLMARLTYVKISGLKTSPSAS